MLEYTTLGRFLLRRIVEAGVQEIRAAGSRLLQERLNGCPREPEVGKPEAHGFPRSEAGMFQVTRECRGCGPLLQKSVLGLLGGCLWATLGSVTALAQAAFPSGPNQTGQPVLGPFQVPTVIVTAQKEPADAQKLPVSLTAASKDTLASAGMTFVSDAAIQAPNTFFSEFTARKLSNPRFRGIGSSPANPGITTYFDGVPQLNTNSSSIELMDVEQIEFVRGPQSALFGRNSLGGLVNVTSSRPSLMTWTGNLTIPVGNNSARDVRGTFSGPLIAGRLGVGGALIYGRRDGFTTNDVTGHDLDSRSAVSGKAQLLWTPAAIWEARLIVTGERARDGDYALNDLAALRRNPFHAMRDFEGHTDRDITATTVLTRREGGRLAFSTATGFVRWKTQDATDLDYSALPLLTRDNTERDFQFTQEVRLASAASAPVALADGVALKWQSGVFLFTQNYEQDAVNNLSPLLSSLPFPLSLHSPQSTLDDVGIGVYGQGTGTFRDRLDISVGARVDYESKEAVLNTFYSPAIAPGTVVNGDKSFSNVSPQLSAAFRVQPEKTIYVSVGRGFKAGGFNPASPAGSEAYGEEHAWHLEGGVKTSWLGNRLLANVAAFSIDWDDLQLNLPNPAVPGQFYIANIGGARSNGVELELNARAYSGVDLFGAFGYTHARFKDGSSSSASGVDVSGNKVPSTPDYTATLGAQFSRALHPAATLRGRAEVVFYGGFQYDEANTAAQEAYSLANFTGGLHGKYLFAEAWVRNAFDSRYVPIAFSYPNFAPSGFIGESGRPRTFGVTAGVTF
jgi:iron complex outermembrane recepter protein